MSSDTKKLLALLLLVAVLAVFRLGIYDLSPPDEPRFAEVAREMMESGDYLVPRVNGMPYEEKPPLMFWLTALFSWPFGEVTEVTARLPSVLGALLAVTCTFLLSRDMFGSRAAFWSALILITTQRFWWQSRLGQLDMLLTGLLAVALYALWRWHRTQQTRLLLLLYAAMALAALVKGPPAFIFPLLCIWTFYWSRREDRRRLHLVIGSTFVLLVFCLWLVPARMAITPEAVGDTSTNIGQSLFRQTIGRFFLGVSHMNPPWYYLFQLPIDLMPWSLFLPWTLPWLWRRRKDSEEVRFLWCWVVPALIFFSICLGKREIYVLPLYPAFAILFACSILDFDVVHHPRRARLVEHTWLLALIAVPAAAALSRLSPYSLPLLYIVILAAGAMALAATYFLSIKAARRQYLPHLLCVSVILLDVVVVNGALPIINVHKSARQFCLPLLHLQQKEVDYNLYSIGYSREEYVFYARHFHTPLLTDTLPSDGNMESARDQMQLLRTVGKAMSKTPIEAIENPTVDEVASLKQQLEAIEANGAAAWTDPRMQRGLHQVLDAFVADMHGSSPVFAMVQEHDWKWILALYPGTVHLQVIENRNVGSRHVLLIANSAGANAVRTMHQRDQRQANVSRLNSRTEVVATPLYKTKHFG